MFFSSYYSAIKSATTNSIREVGILLLYYSNLEQQGTELKM
jgi:hypothetical protein